MLQHSRSLPYKLWAKAINYALYIQNRSPHNFFTRKTPFEAWGGMQPKVTHFWISCMDPNSLRKEEGFGT